MALITGSSTTDWSTISLSQVDFAAHIVQASNRSDQIGAELISGNWFLVSASPTRIVVDLFSGGRIAIGGSGFNTSNPIVRSVSFFNTATGEILRYTGFSNGVGNGSLTSLTYGTTSFAESFIGNVTTFENDPNNQNDDTYAGPVTSLTARIGAATVTLSGTFNLTGDDVTAALTGTVTGIVVASGTNSIKMTGLSVDIDVLEAAFASNALSTVSDLFSVVGNQLNGDDLITYTNNSGVGMSFFGGAGNDTINISGIRGDTLNGGAGNDILVGGLGQDTVNGEAGDDQITMLVTAGNVDTIDAGADTDMLVLSGAVGGNGLVVVDLSAADQVVSIAGDPNRDNQIQTGFEGVNGALLGSAMTVTGSAGDNVIIGSNGADTIDGGAGNDTLHGGAGNDQLIGGTDNDVLNGGTGNDTMTGGLGDDTYVIDNLGDQITELSGEGSDTVQINRTVDLNVAPFTEIENVVLTGVAALNATGDGGANSLTGNSAANILTGGDGNDTLTGGLGNDTLNGGTGDDAMDGGAGNDVFLIGDAGEHGVGEVLDGGTGTDVLRFTSTSDDQTLALTAGVTGIEAVVIANAAGLSTGTTDLNVDASAVTSGLLMTGNAGDNELTGTGFNDILNGGAGDDTLDGRGGTNLLIGGKGDDTFIVATATDLVSEGLNGGLDTVEAAINYVLGANVENLELTGNLGINGTGNALNNSITGNDEANVLIGNAGNDTLEGEAGADTVLGGTGNDRIVMDVEAGAIDIADGGLGLDTLALVGTVGGSGLATVSLAAGAGDQVTDIGGTPEGLLQNNFEHLDASGLAGTVNATGSAGANVMIGSTGNDVLNGAAGNDVLSGGAGDDDVQGGAGNDVILIGDAGEHGGSEVLDGGIGTDVLRFTSTSDDQTLVLTAGVTGIESVVIANAAGLTTGTTDLNVDASAVTSGLLMTGNAGDNELTGTAFNDVLTGGAGDDTLDGGGGTNLLVGGAGNDTFIVATATDLVSEGLNGGIDTVEAAINYVLGANVENLELTGNADITGTGNALNNSITGNDGANVLIGGAGNDLLEGEDGADTVLGGIGNDRIVMDVAAGNVDTADGGIGLDTLALVGTVPGGGIVTVDLGVGDQVTHVDGVGETLVQNNFEHLDASELDGTVNATGSAGANLLIGSDGADVLSGLAGNDVLSGGAGDDTMVGGAGNDTFLFDAGDGQDVIQDNGGVADVVRFGATIDSQDLVISRQADDLRLAVAGSTDSVTIQNWYTDPVNRTETIQAGDGQTLLSAQVDVLIQAMATFTTQTGVTWETASTGGGTPEAQTAFQNIIAANWQ